MLIKFVKPETNEILKLHLGGLKDLVNRVYLKISQVVINQYFRDTQDTEKLTNHTKTIIDRRGTTGR